MMRHTTLVCILLSFLVLFSSVGSKPDKHMKTKKMNYEVRSHKVKTKPSKPLSSKGHSNDCQAYKEYKQLKDYTIPETKTTSYIRDPTLTYACTDFQTCLEVHLANLRKHGLNQRCAIGENITNMKDRHITFTHIPKAGGSTVHYLLTSTPELKQRKRNFADPHLPFYAQQVASPDDFYLTTFRDPVNMLISFFNYVAQRSMLPRHARCNIGWESAFDNKKTPLQFAQHHHDVTEGDFLHYFLPTVPNASAVLRAWPAYKAMQKLPSENLTLRSPWVSHFPKEEYMQYLSDNSSHIPEEYQCKPYIEASILLLTRYAAVGTLENISDMYKVFYHRAQVEEHVDTSSVRNPSTKVMSSEVESEVKKVLKEKMFCQILMWKMAFEINSFDLQCIAEEKKAF